jgi:hypothetical protein
LREPGIEIDTVQFLERLGDASAPGAATEFCSVTAHHDILAWISNSTNRRSRCHRPSRCASASRPSTAPPFFASTLNVQVAMMVFALPADL